MNALRLCVLTAVLVASFTGTQTKLDGGGGGPICTPDGTCHPVH